MYLLKGWAINDAKVVCWQLGYNNARNATIRGLLWRGYYSEDLVPRFRVYIRAMKAPYFNVIIREWASMTVTILWMLE